MKVFYFSLFYISKTYFEPHVLPNQYEFETPALSEKWSPLTSGRWLIAAEFRRIEKTGPIKHRDENDGWLPLIWIDWVVYILRHNRSNFSFICHPKHAIINKVEFQFPNYNQKLFFPKKHICFSTGLSWPNFMSLFCFLVSKACILV